MLPPAQSHEAKDAPRDPWLFGWDVAPGVVSVWADRLGQARVWRRRAGRVVLERESFRAWVYARSARDWEAARRAKAPGHERVECERLDGAEGSYRFLLSGPSVELLQSVLGLGASARLERPHVRLRDLGGEYYEVGAHEQYLMGRGRTYFGGLGYEDLHRMQLDLETTSLSAESGHIFLAALRDNRGFQATLEAGHAGGERELIERLLAVVEERDPDVIENHNLFGFDLPFLHARARRHGLALALGRGRAPVEPLRQPGRLGGRPELRYRAPGRELLDTLDAVRRYDFVARELSGLGLKEAARYFGVSRSCGVYVPGAEIYATYLRDPARVRAYALGDVEEVDGLSRRLFPSIFALATMAPRRYEQLAAAGPAMGVLEPLIVRAYLRERTALPARGEGAPAEPHAGGSVFLFATGVVARVVKVDVASLYPSLMQAYGIGPRSDTLGVLLHAVRRLLSLRLEHKAASRAREKSEGERGVHEATQAAMKLLINSAYGYMGAGSMALFADRDAADEVTRRGRALLSDLLSALAARGARLIEADTDGVFFSASEGATEDDERTLFAEVAGTMPPGIRLEFEGRYRAMFSHEVKNYALLGHDGTLTLRGVAFRSSRAEPFGERFLREALVCLLGGDIGGVRGVFCRMVDAIRTHALPTADVAVRVRLTKGPREYAATRSGHRESHYEALLAGGRESWAPGERVRIYRSRDRREVCLPEGRGGAADDPRDYDADHYVGVLVRSYAERLRKAFTPDDWERLFRAGGQAGLFDAPLDTIRSRSGPA